ncbi:MAG: hypothetical protein EAS52_18055 [Parapedobacter sp.]|nr:MAG: hypothetical protein EAS52_18055 [Parapedobacter sp.]
MERLVINIPEGKSALVKQILDALGVVIQPIKSNTKATQYKKKLAKVSTWSDDDIKAIEVGTKAFEGLKPQQW